MFSRSVFILLTVLFGFQTSVAQNLTIYKSEKSVDETTSMIMKVIQEEGLMLFEMVNHDELAASRGVKLPPTRSILFEDTELTTALINCQQTVALDLPLEILVWEENGDVYIGFIDPRFMVKRFLIKDCDEVIDELSRLMVRVTMDAIRQL